MLRGSIVRVDIVLVGLLTLPMVGVACSSDSTLTTEEVIASCDETNRRDREFQSAHGASDPATFEEALDPSEVITLIESLVTANRAVASWEHTSNGEILFEMADYQQGLADEVAKADDLTLVKLGEITSSYGDPDLEVFSELETDPTLVFDPEFVAELGHSSCAAIVESVSEMDSFLSDQ